jgi:hypothetical protein
MRHARGTDHAVRAEASDNQCVSPRLLRMAGRQRRTERWHNRPDGVPSCLGTGENRHSVTQQMAPIYGRGALIPRTIAACRIRI